MKKLVAYFSASGITRKVAQRLASAVGADIFEIEPVDEYTEADLNWMDANSRSSVEMKEKPDFRPAIKNKIENFADYDEIYLGFPIWWYTCPTIINTFVESYDFTGKTIHVFATSGSSKMEDTKTEESIKKSLGGKGTIAGCKRVEANIGEDELGKLF